MVAGPFMGDDLTDPLMNKAAFSYFNETTLFSHVQATKSKTAGCNIFPVNLYVFFPYEEHT